MRLHRFFVKEKVNKSRDIIKISEERIVHQVRNVFRLKTGDKVIIFDGSGSDFECEILDADKKNFELKVIEERKVFVPQKQVTLFMSVIRKENFELVCEKATELGVTKIVPIVTERTLQKNLNRERIEKILIEASEQCGRGDVPEFGKETKLLDVLEEENLFVCDMGGEDLKNLNIQSKDSKILIGPEGGWSEDEREKFKDKKIKTVSLGETVLRAETAAIVGVALL